MPNQSSELSSSEIPSTHITTSVPLPRLGRSLGWLLIIAVAYFMGAIIYGIYLGAVEGFQQIAQGGGPLDEAAMQQKIQLAMASPAGIGLVYCLQFSAVMPLLLLASHFATQHFRETLAIKLFPPKLLVVWCALLLVYFVAQYGIVKSFNVDTGEFLELVSGTRHLGFSLVVVLLAPVMEELLFRGYLFKVLRQTWLKFVGTLFITSLLFTLIHAGQYGLGVLSILFVFSLMLGIAREKSGSVLLPIILHAINNFVFVVLIVYVGMDY